MIFFAVLLATLALTWVIPARWLQWAVPAPPTDPASGHARPPGDLAARLTGRDRARLAMALAFFAAGLTHFLAPRPYLQMLPAGLPYPLLVVYASGLLEMLGGLGLLWPRTRRHAALGLVALLVAVFPANLNVALGNIAVDGYPGGWYPWARLPFQLVFIGWLLWSTTPNRPVATTAPRLTTPPPRAVRPPAA